MTEFGRDADPVPPQDRIDDPGRDARAHEIEAMVVVDLHTDFAGPGDGIHERVHYVMAPDSGQPHGFSTEAFIWRAGGAWWFSHDPSPLQMESPSGRWALPVELTVETVREAKLYARRRAAWELA